MEKSVNRRRFLRDAASVGAAALLTPTLAQLAEGAQKQTAPAQGKPNIVVIIADDLTYHDLGCWGSKDAKTPNLDKLASEGMRLTRCYTPAPVCSPTRQALYDGLYPVRSGAYPNHTFIKPGIKTLPQYLTPLGYRVGLVGKRHFAPAESYPFEYPQKGAGNGDGPLDLNAAEAFITRDKKQPYCLVVASHEPHSPWNQGDASQWNPDKLTLPPYLADTPATRQALARYFAEVEVFDKQVGRVMEAVEKSGQKDNTLFLFLSEQGSSAPFGKWTLYDAGIRAAVIARWPAKIKAGSQCDALCQYIDFLPTFMEMAGGKPPKDLDGRSILNLLIGKSSKGRDYVFAEETSRGIIGGPEAYGIRAVADTRWKLIRNLNPEAEFKGGAIPGPAFRSWEAPRNASNTFARSQAAKYRKRPATELYDLQADPYELKNLADTPDQKDNLKRLNAQLDAWMKQQGDEGVKTEMEAKKHQTAGRED